MYSKFLKINSAYRTSGESHDFRIDLPTHIRGSSLKLSQVFILNTFYNVNKNNDKFFFNLNGGYTRTAIVPVGNYNSTTFPTAFQTALNVAIFSEGVFSVVLNDLSNKLEITCSVPFQVKMGDNPEKSLRDIVGFRSDGFIALSHTAEGILNLSPIMSFNISVNNIPVIEQAGGNQYATTFSVPVSEGFKNIIEFSPDTHFPQVLELPNTVRTLRITVRDDDYNLLDLNGSNWYMILERNNLGDENQIDMDFS